MQEVYQQELMHAGPAPVAAFAGMRGEPVVDGKPLGLLPQRRQFDVVDPVTPRIEVRQPGFVEAIGTLEIPERAGCPCAEFVQFRLQGRGDARRQAVAHETAQQPVVPEAVPGPWLRLNEGRD